MLPLHIKNELEAYEHKNLISLHHQAYPETLNQKFEASICTGCKKESIKLIGRV